MSSMLKKTGGLSFKPKAGRRPGAGASKPPPATAPPAPPAPLASSTTTSDLPPIEDQSQTTTETSNTITASGPPPPTVVDSAEPTEPTALESGNVPTESVPPKPTHLGTASASEPSVEQYSVQPTAAIVESSPVAPDAPVIQEHTPQPTNDACQEAAPRTHELPAVNTHPQGELTITPAEENPVTQKASLGHVPATTIAPTITPDSPRPPLAATELPTAPPAPLPVSSTIPSASSDGAQKSQPTRPRKQAPRKRKTTAAEGTTEPTPGAEPKQKRARKKAIPRPTTASNTEEASPPAPKVARRRWREPTPENAEELTVDHTKMTVGELTKDLGIGKRFKHAEEIEQRAREARAKYRQKRLEREKRKLGLLPPEDDDLESQADEGESRRAGADLVQLGALQTLSGGQGVGYDVVDGQIVVHAASLVINRHNQDMSNLEEVEENDFTNLVNSGSFAKRVQGPGNWTDEETEKFYRLLGMFGTDFETISRLFPGKNRRAIKLKFNKEERLRPNRVNAAMMVRGQKKVNIDLEEYKAAQRQWEAKEKILEENARLAEEQEREVARLRDERRAAGLIDDDDTTTPAAGRSNAGAGISGGATTAGGEYEVIEEDADALGQGAMQDAEVNGVESVQA
ncbi:hypothetical protein F5Y17DRAFT_443118 [Xylariaceae sp. FL0594]|nr:hypothetical protein F5Y17DRAFT_443118 [Xylariaceae sp. FL0594]